VLPPVDPDPELLDPEEPLSVPLVLVSVAPSFFGALPSFAALLSLAFVSASPPVFLGALP